MTSGKAFVLLDRLLESQTTGPLYLKMPEIAKLVVEALERGSKSEYILHAWVVMPNHVHILITPQADVSKALQRLKGSTAREATSCSGGPGLSGRVTAMIGSFATRTSSGGLKNI